MSENNTAVNRHNKSPGRIYLAIYLAISFVLALISCVFIYRYGLSGFYLIQGPADAAPVEMKFAVFCIAWIFTGFVLVLTYFPSFTRRHALFLLVLVPLVFMYLNDVREPHKVKYGDFPAYHFAAVDINNGQPISQQPGRLYRYPPLLATVLTPLASLGLDRANEIFRLMNLFALVLLVCLLYLSLRRYAFSRELAAIVIFLALCINVPVSRTLIYQQVNLYIVDLMLLSLLFYPRFLFLSAVSLSVAIHVKIYPILLALPFFYIRDWRWCTWFLASMAGIVLTTSLISSFDYYVDFAHVMLGWTLEGEASAFKETGIRNVSIEALVYNTLRLSGLDLWKYEQAIVIILRLLLVGLFVKASWSLMRNDSFHVKSGMNPVILNGYVILPLFMLLVSPSVWPHHFVLLVLTMPVLLSSLRDGSHFWLFCAAYVLIFHFPVNEIYPVSYLRLLGLVLIGVLLNRLARETQASEPAWFGDMKKRLGVIGARRLT